MDPMTLVATALTSLKTATEIAQIFKVSDDTFAKAELKMKVAELMTALADAKIALSELKENLYEKDQEIKKLKALADKEPEMVFENGIYRHKNDDGKLEGGYCPRCFDDEKKAIRLRDYGNGFFRCPKCDKTFESGVHVPEQAHSPKNNFEDDNSFWGNR